MEQTWWTIPERHHSVCVSVRLVIFADTERSSQAKVSQFQYAIFGYQYVGGFHVTVQNLWIVGNFIDREPEIWNQ